MGISELAPTIPHMLLKRLTKLNEVRDDPVLEACRQPDHTIHLIARLRRLTTPTAPAQKWKEAIEAENLTKGLQAAVEDPASRHWVDNPRLNGLAVIIWKPRQTYLRQHYRRIR